MGLKIIDSNPVEDLFCKMCISTKLFLFEKDELIYKCRTCGSLFKYNRPVKRAQLGIDPELNNEASSSIFFYKPQKTKKENLLPEVAGNAILKQSIDVK